MTTLIDVPVEYTEAPNGVLHLKRQDPNCIDTLCGMNTRVKVGKAPWLMGDETQNGGSATCLPCRLNLRRAQEGADEWGNFLAQEGCDRCFCGAKYWENDFCTSCGHEWLPEFRGDDEEDEDDDV